MTDEALAADPGIVRDWQRACRQAGVLVRPLATGVAVSPPLVCDRAEIALLAEGIEQALEQVGATSAAVS